MNNDLERTLQLSPYPLMNMKKKHYDGLFFHKNTVCDTCDNFTCMNLKDLKDLEISECHNMLLFFKLTIFGEKYIVYGLNNDFRILNKNDKKKYTNKLYFKNLNLMKNWKNNANKIYNKALLDKEEIEKNDSIFIHDIKKTYSTIYRKIETYILKHCETPQNLDECIKNMDVDILGMYKAINLIDYQFNIIDYISNPDSITYGGKKPIKVYKIVDKLVRILQTTSPVPIELGGTSHKTLYLYESFIALVFVILDNAIKYSFPKQDVIVSINDVGSDVEIIISSYSPYISDEEKESIFKKYYRANTDKEGQGIGLYLAKIISDALQAPIEINNNNAKTNCSGIDYVTTEFKFFITNLD